MGSRRDTAQLQGPSPRIYLITPRIEDPAALMDALAEALAAAEIAAVLLATSDRDGKAAIDRIAALVPVVQKGGAAALADESAELAIGAGADGMHATGIDAITVALEALKPVRIVGAGGLKTRHDAMLAAEAGADYVMFGEPDPSGQRVAFDWTLGRVAWWAELFEVPCVGFADDLAEVAALAAAGADFVAASDLVWNDRRGPAAAVRAVAEHLVAPEPAQ
jgi:thiamine-phosphate pyrophosphorylase